MARHWRDSSLEQLLKGELRVGTTLEALRAACELQGVTAPQLEAPTPPAKRIVLLSVIQLRGVTLTQINPTLSKSPALPIAWQLHQRALAAALEPLTRLEANLRRIARFLPMAQWSTFGLTLLIGAGAGLQRLQAALHQGLLTMGFFAALALVQFLLRFWLRRSVTKFLMERLLGTDSD